MNFTIFFIGYKKKVRTIIQVVGCYRLDYATSAKSTFIYIEELKEINFSGTCE